MSGVTDFEAAKIAHVQEQITNARAKHEKTEDPELRVAYSAHISKLKAKLAYLKKRKDLGPEAYKAQKRAAYHKNTLQKLQRKLDELESLASQHPDSSTLSDMIQDLRRKRSKRATAEDKEMMESTLLNGSE